MTALVTYELNGYTLESSADNIEFENLVLWVVNAKPPIDQIATRLKKLVNEHSTKKVSQNMGSFRKLFTPYNSEGQFGNCLFGGAKPKRFEKSKPFCFCLWLHIAEPGFTLST